MNEVIKKFNSLGETENKKEEKGEEKNGEKKKKTTITVSENLKFDSNVEVCYTNTLELTTVVDDLFAQSFRDYAGCEISMNNGSNPLIQNEVPYGALYVTIYFKTNAGNGAIPNVENRAEKKTTNKLDTLMKMGSKSFGRKYDITPQTYEALEDFIFFKGRRNPNWNKLTFERAVPVGYITGYNQEIVASVTGLSLDAIINCVYGITDDSGNKFEYRTIIIQLVANKPNEYVVQIEKLDEHAAERLQCAIGGPVQNFGFHRYVK